MSRKRLARNAAASIVQVMFAGGALFLQYRVMMHWLPMDQIGLWALIVGSVAVARLAELGMGASVVRFVARDMSAGNREHAAMTIGMAAIWVGITVGTVALIAQPVILPLLLKVAPPTLHIAARTLLTASLISVTIGSVATVFLNALDGCQRMDLRAGVQIAGNTMQLAGTVLVLPRMGVAGLGLVQIAYAAVLLIAAGTITAVLVGRGLRSYVRSDRGRLRELFIFGGGLQLASIAQLLFEPLIKVLLTAFSGLAMTGYFDMANRLVTQARAVIVAASTALVPHVAARSSDLTPDEVRSTYREVYDLLLFSMLPYFAVLSSSMPLILVLWKGHFDPTFLIVALVQLAGWTFNSASTAAYMLFMGMGRLRWNILSHVSIGLITLGAGSLLGWLAGGYGVLAAALTALVAGSLVVPIAFQREYGLPAAEIMPRRRLPMLALLLAAMTGGWVIALALAAPSSLLLVGLPLVVTVIGLAIMARDPMRQTLLGQLRKWAN